MKIDLTECEGLWILTQRWSLSYWPPRAWKPLSVRDGQRGWCGRLGAVAVGRRRDPQPTTKWVAKEDRPFGVDEAKVLSTLWSSDHPMLHTEPEEER